MPNWCENEVTITADPATIDEVRTLLEAQHGICEELIPIPEGQTGVSAWCDEHWGSYSLYGFQLTCDEPQKLVFSMESGWSPLEPTTAALAARFPTADIEHFWNESYSDSSGVLEYESGRLVYSGAGVATTSCGVCGDGRVYNTEVVCTPNGDTFHLGCGLADAEVLVTCPSPDVLDALAESITGRDLVDMLGLSAELPYAGGELVALLTSDGVDECGYADWPEETTWSSTVRSSVTSGGSVKLTYETLVCDIGGSMLTLSACFPAATFYLSVSHEAFGDKPTQAVIARGQTVNCTQTPWQQSAA